MGVLSSWTTRHVLISGEAGAVPNTQSRFIRMQPQFGEHLTLLDGRFRRTLPFSLLSLTA
jgi:hypothetical protein